MSRYTTGEVARLAGITVRTVQYYDTRGVLAPSALSEGGRRLYSDDDLQRLRIVCFLRQMGLSIDGIRQLLTQDASQDVIDTLLATQRQTLESEIAARQAQLRSVTGLQAALKSLPQFSVGAIGDIATVMQNRAKRKKMLVKMLCVGIFMDLIQIAGVVTGCLTGNWWPLAGAFAASLGLGFGISWWYFAKTAFICPGCHTVFRVPLRDSFFARHTSRLRFLTCPHCGRRGYCVEIYQEEQPHAEN